jgi:hypothetical protein
MSAGKGDKPRSCFSKKFKDNYDGIVWKSKGTIMAEETRKLTNKLSKTERQKLSEKALEIIYGERN